MKARTTWLLVVLAAGLFAFIALFERHLHPSGEAALPSRILPQLNAAAVTSIQVRPGNQLEICVERTNNTWQLTKPLVYPAHAPSVEGLLRALANLAGQAQISAEDLRSRTNADKEFGFDPPQFTLVLHQGNYRHQILVGARTALKDQVFFQAVGTVGIFLVDADLLKLIPSRVDGWRDPMLIDLNRLVFDRLAVTNGAKVLELQWDATNKLWRMTHPMLARVDNPKIEDALQKLQNLRVHQFVSDDPKADLDAFGLQPPGLELALRRGTNPVALLQFGRSPTNEPGQLYARRPDQNAIVLVTSEPLAAWRAAYTEFRDRHLVALAPGSVDAFEIRGAENFTVQHVTNHEWRVVGPQTFPADAGLVNELFGNLSALEVVEFVKDVVTPLDLTTYGLAPPARQFILKTSPAKAGPTSTNTVIAELNFGATQNDRVFARRADENAVDRNSVFAVKLADCQRLPSAGWQFRDRRIWNFTENDVARLTIRQNGKVRELVRAGTNQWAFAPGSQGIINDFAIEETVHRLGELAAARWIDRGDQNRAHYGFAENSYRLTIETKQGAKLTLELSGMAVSGEPCASVPIDGQNWIFEFPRLLYQFVENYLTIPDSIP